ncbi:MAG: hypothetical protein ACYTBJ_06770 [Planctomycetota bacterium]|jgi:hypothetical protein
MGYIVAEQTETGLGVAPAVAAAASYAAKGLVSKIFGGFGQSKGFQEREAKSKQFFDTRNAVFDMEPMMTPEQMKEWKNLQLHKTDYNTRRENDHERNQLYAFVKKLSDPGAWTISTPVTTKTATATLPQAWTAAAVQQPPARPPAQASMFGGMNTGTLALLAALGIGAFVFMKGR